MARFNVKFIYLTQDKRRNALDRNRIIDIQVVRQTEREAIDFANQAIYDFPVNPRAKYRIAKNIIVTPL